MLSSLKPTRALPAISARPVERPIVWAVQRQVERSLVWAVVLGGMTSLVPGCTGSSSSVDPKAQPRSGVLVVGAGGGMDGGARTTSAAAARTASTALHGPGANSPQPAASTGPRYVGVTIGRSLESSLDEALGPDLGTPLSQVATRVLVWWVDVHKDIRKGDRVELIFEPRAGEEPTLRALWFTSSKLGKKVGAVAYQAKGSPFARWYTDDGSEVELRLKGGPIDDYEQITSLLNDGRRHKGIDFKTPVGTNVKSPCDGVVLRRNWGRRNGNCLEIEDVHTGRHVKLLHLDSIDPSAMVGAHVRKGQVIAKSGNTGRSMAPHLHYQLEAGGRVVDPFKIHETWRSKLPPEEAERAKAMLGRYSELRTGAT